MNSLTPSENLIAAGLEARILVPDDADFTARQESYWSNSAKIKPACIVQPHTADEVANIVKALVAAGHKFAIRSGGHTNWAGSNNIEGGVTVDLVHLNNVSFDPSTETVDVGPGCRWRDVYSQLSKYGRAVAGGREGNPGVAGLLLGGGNTFFTGLQGFGCDNVVSYQVVLASGDIVTADNKTNIDLFRVLKGGSNNFGIVTNFTMKAIKVDRVWGGMVVFPKQAIPGVIEALSDFTDNVANDIHSNLVTVFQYLPNLNDISTAAVYANMEGIEKAAAYKKWLALPEISSRVKDTTVVEIASDYNLPPDY
ncbi:hypothetical protein FSHL1_004860 [Fusarium sambucinum]